MTSTSTTFPLAVSSQMSRKWAWFLALGIAFIGLGVIAISNLVLATIVTVYYVGLLMVIAGAAQFFHSFGVRLLDGFFFWLFGSFLYFMAGITAIINPLLASFVLTLLLGVFAAASGLSRIWVGLRAKARHGWGWIVASGVVTTIVGSIFLLGWPADSVWLLGLVLSIDLIFQGCAMIGLATRLRTA